MRMRHIITFGLSGPSYKRHDLKKKLSHMKCVLIFSTMFVWNICYSKNSARHYRECTNVFMWCAPPAPLSPLFLWDFNETWISSTDFRKLLNYQISLIKTVWEPGGGADGQTWRSWWSLFAILQTRLKIHMCVGDWKSGLKWRQLYRNVGILNICSGNSKIWSHLKLFQWLFFSDLVSLDGFRSYS